MLNKGIFVVFHFFQVESYPGELLFLCPEQFFGFLQRLAQLFVFPGFQVGQGRGKTFLFGLKFLRFAERVASRSGQL